MISVFELFSIGIGPSSSHTVGPMIASARFLHQLNQLNLKQSARIQVELYGSLAQTGRGHATDVAIILGLQGYRPESVNPEKIQEIVDQTHCQNSIQIGAKTVEFNPKTALIFHYHQVLPLHVNGMTFSLIQKKTTLLKKTYYSIGGGFVLDADEIHDEPKIKTQVPFEFSSAQELLQLGQKNQMSIAELVLANEVMYQNTTETRDKLWQLWQTMQSSIEQGCQTQGVLPGGLNVKRRAADLHQALLSQKDQAEGIQALDWVSMYAMAVNEENAAGGRIVTAPTNGAAGIIPAVLAYIDQFITPVTPSLCEHYLLTSAAIGMLYKKNASISGAEVGCQGEVGVACSMAAAGLAAVMKGSNQQIENAAEIAMEHNLGLTCDPVAGLVQIPCIERNGIAAVKAINAAQLALRGDGSHRITLDKVIEIMMQTGQDMKSKYKETAQGGLAVNIIEC
jgi:L-serine dehydratase